MSIQQINTLPPDEVKREMEKAQSLNRVHFEFRHRLADGSVRDVSVFSGRIEAKGKEILHSIIHDITDRKRAEASLAESEAKFRNYVDNAPIGIFQLDEGGRFLDANPAVLQFTGYGAEEIREVGILDLVPEENRKEVTRFLGLLKNCGWSAICRTTFPPRCCFIWRASTSGWSTCTSCCKKKWWTAWWPSRAPPITAGCR